MGYSHKHRRYAGAATEVDGYMYITAYFIDPDNVCKNDAKRETGIIGDRLEFFKGDKNYMTIPMMEEDIKQTKWVKGKCFYLMGNIFILFADGI